MSSQDVCRLCLTTNNLFSLYAKQVEKPEKMREMIFVTTGVQISQTDEISQMICSGCCQIILTMFKFRSTALRNDRYLKMRPKLIQEIKEEVEEPQNEELLETHQDEEPNPPQPQPPSSTILNSTNSKLHPSVITIFQNFKSLQVPPQVLDIDLLPSIVLSRLSPEDLKKYSPKTKNNFARKKTAVTSNSENRTNPERISLKFLLSKTSGLISRRDDSDDMNKSEFIKSLGLEPKKSRLTLSTDSPKQPVSYVEKSVKTLVCHYCNAVFYSSKTLKYHQRRVHMRCQYCKHSFRSIEARKHHVESSCEAYRALKRVNEYKVQLTPIEKDVDVRKMYSSAFGSFEPLKPVEEPRISVNLESEKKTVTFERPQVHILNESLSINSEVKHEEGSNEGLHNIDPILITSDDDSVQTEDTVIIEGQGESSSLDKDAPREINPRIQVKNCPAINNNIHLTSYLALLKNLMAEREKSRNNVDEHSSQTVVFENKNIYMLKDKKKVFLKTLRSDLQFHKVPIVIENGSFSVNVRVNIKSNERQSESSLWNDKDIIEMPLRERGRLMKMLADSGRKSNPVVTAQKVAVAPNVTITRPPISNVLFHSQQMFRMPGNSPTNVQQRIPNHYTNVLVQKPIDNTPSIMIPYLPVPPSAQPNTSGNILQNSRPLVNRMPNMNNSAPKSGSYVRVKDIWELK